MNVCQTTNLVSSQNRPQLRLDFVSPNSGPTAGGTEITVYGEGFLPGLTARLSGTPCTNVVVLSSTVFTATTPAHSAGAKTLRVRLPATETFLDLLVAFTYS